MADTDKVIYKYELDGGLNKIELPVGAEVLSVGHQNGTPYMWALHTHNVHQNERVLRYFRVAMTGHPWDGKGKFIGTIQIPTAFVPIVLHVFDVSDTIGG